MLCPREGGRGGCSTGIDLQEIPPTKTTLRCRTGAWRDRIPALRCGSQRFVLESMPLRRFSAASVWRRINHRKPTGHVMSGWIPWRI